MSATSLDRSFVTTTMTLIITFVFVIECAWAETPVAQTELAPARWVETARIPADEAHQAAAADEKYFYAINNSTVARYDRQTGKKVAISSGTAKHLNSGWLHGDQLFCAHSNYPQKPEQSEIKVLDLKTMQLESFKDFGASPHGSLTWAVQENNHWWCNFAHYGDQNHRTVLVKFDAKWNEVAKWTYPPEVLFDLGQYSISGGIWHEGVLLTTGHDNQVLYRLKLPKSGGVLSYLNTIPAPFTGQGIAADPLTGGLVGINRKQRLIILAKPIP